jgi:hypothetical protein
MTDTHLLLPGAKTAILIPNNRMRAKRHWSHMMIIGFGLLVILVGAADLLTRLSHKAFGECGAAVIFGPAISVLDTSNTPSVNPCK